MPSPSHPSQLTPEARRHRVAALLATGLIRVGTALVAPTSLPQPDSKNVSESLANQLADSGYKSVTVTVG